MDGSEAQLHPNDEPLLLRDIGDGTEIYALHCDGSIGHKLRRSTRAPRRL
jgi:hypothetical protein